jgi:hypothetical protein
MERSPCGLGDKLGAVALVGREASQRGVDLGSGRA